METAGGASDWSGHSVDEDRGIVYISTETAGPDFWGGDRYGANLFANSLIALDAGTARTATFSREGSRTEAFAGPRSMDSPSLMNVANLHVGLVSADVFDSAVTSAHVYVVQATWHDPPRPVPQARWSFHPPRGQFADS